MKNSKNKEGKELVTYIIGLILLWLIFWVFGLNAWIKNNYQDVVLMLLVVIVAGIVLIGKEIEKLSDRLYDIEAKLDTEGDDPNDLGGA